MVVFHLTLRGGLGRHREGVLGSIRAYYEGCAPRVLGVARPSSSAQDGLFFSRDNFKRPLRDPK